MRRAGWAAAAAVIGWYAFALWILHPLTDAPVVDSWLYGSAVRRFLRTGEVRFAGFTQDMPIAQVYYGVAWSHAFGANSVSLEMSVVTLAVLCGVMFHALAIKCGAPRWQALAATGLLICNPCFTFLSFSFMTEIPFLMAMIAAHLAFAKAEGRHEQLWMWLAGAMAVVAFMIRPFGGMAIAGCVGAMLLFDARMPRTNRWGRAQWIKMMAPFGVALSVCAALWIWLTILSPRSWDLQLNENHFHYLFLVPLASYLRAGVLGPLLYLGTVLSPLALLQLDDSAMAASGDGRRGNFRGRADLDVDRSLNACHARVQLLRRMAQRADIARRDESLFVGWRMAVRIPCAGERGRSGINRSVRDNLQNARPWRCGNLDRGGSLLGGDDTAVVLQRSLLPGDGAGQLRSCLRSRRCLEAGWSWRRDLR